MSLGSTWQVMNLAHAVTMLAVAGQTVKPGQFRVAKIFGISVGISFWQTVAAGLDARICWKIRVFGLGPFLCRRGLLNGRFTTPGSRRLAGRLQPEEAPGLASAAATG
jgi:hypothetical protein